ncbi:UvrB/UvrC motif-containing protein [Draconibacterium mangrovi]|uniref:UvrB/UvrC motif-containing protein n=1 Tax=Draconibacterium mangrovi TaxID=2697469 RepID=UPI0013D79F4F|nr:UvrB/UvrC motif-containing protein [Draconibacterium mangrovi]
MKKYLAKGTLTISTHRTTIYFRNEESKCYNFQDDHLNPHYQLWEHILGYLSRRGFHVTADPRILKEYRCLTKDHKYGIKNNLEFKTERFPTGFNIEFYQNINTEHKSGGEYDFRKYELMPYLIKLSFRNEVLRLAEYARKKGVNVVIEKPLSDIKKIIEDNQKNPHVHGPDIYCLQDIAKYMDKPGMCYNDKDANGKKIICGEIKAFYNSKRRLLIGEVWHHINNMWWVLINGERHNIASFHLFDYSPDLPNRKPLTHNQQIQRLHSELQKAADQQNYERCIVLRDKLKDVKLYRVWSINHGCWWRPDSSGYTSDKNKAGVYTDETINNNSSYFNNQETTKAIPVES